MIYILVALKAEAQAFIDKKIDAQIIVSGMGSQNMQKATQVVVDKMNKDDKIVNVGICAASKNYKIGQLIDGFKEKIVCVDEAVDDKNRYNIVDMESAGFLEASLHVENRYIFKIVSDNFEPHTVTKDGAKKLIFNNIDKIMEKLDAK